MASLITELIDTLTQQNNIYISLLDIASKKKVSIIENNLESLQNFVKEENILIGKNQRLEKKRIEIFSDIKMVLGKKNDLSLTDIVESIKGQEGEKELENIKNKIIYTLDKLKSLNDQNQQLIQMSLDYVDFSMNLIRNATNNNPTYYDLAGNEINASDRKMFDARQ